jgi:hypothetical protein
MTVKLIRMTTGEDVVASIVEDTSDTISIKDPIVAVPAGNNQLGFAPWSPILSDDVDKITVEKKFIIFISDVKSEVIDHYTKMFSRVIVPDSKIIV